MSSFLYRGVSLIDDEKNEGRIFPKGKYQQIEGQCGDPWVECGEGIECGASNNNAIIAHRFDSEVSNTSYISTSKSFGVAKKFATTGNLVEGYVYTLNVNMFDKYGVFPYEIYYSDEDEVTLSLSTDFIPEQVIVEKQLVRPE